MGYVMSLVFGSLAVWLLCDMAKLARNDINEAASDMEQVITSFGTSMTEGQRKIKSWWAFLGPYLFRLMMVFCFSAFAYLSWH
jgi:hypothetical protein